eukprot:1937257-Prymnesium_polylepis.1
MKVKLLSVGLRCGRACDNAIAPVRWQISTARLACAKHELLSPRRSSSSLCTSVTRNTVAFRSNRFGVSARQTCATRFFS